jgi:hypothetical protein
MKTKLWAGFLFCSSALTAASFVAAAPGSPVTVDGEVNLHGVGATSTGVASDGENTPADLIPEFVYTAPTSWDTVNASEVGPVTLVGPGVGLTTTVKFNGSGGDSTVATPGASQLKFTSGGTVIVHIPGNLIFDHTTVLIEAGTQVVFMVDGDVTFNWADIQQTGGGRLFVQSGGDITVNTEKFIGAAFANNNLNITATAGLDNSNILLDGAFADLPTPGAVEPLRMLPIVEGK